MGGTARGTRLGAGWRVGGGVMRVGEAAPGTEAGSERANQNGQTELAREMAANLPEDT